MELVKFTYQNGFYFVEDVVSQKIYKIKEKKRAEVLFGILKRFREGWVEVEPESLNKDKLGKEL